jgi:hypothetical protein
VVLFGINVAISVHGSAAKPELAVSGANSACQPFTRRLLRRAVFYALWTPALEARTWRAQKPRKMADLGPYVFAGGL